jgi:hypothetical protein
LKEEILVALIANKEKSDRTVLERELGVKCFVIPEFDTDELGTLQGSGEKR